MKRKDQSRRHGRKRPAEEVMAALAREGIVDLPTRTGEVGLHPGIKVRDPEEALEILDGLIRERKRR